jgi:regulator of protease activity HflC (stomatin/prohibitin superfamily)
MHPAASLAFALASDWLSGWLSAAPGWLRGTLEWLWEEHKRDVLVAAWAGVWGVMRLAGKTVNSGEIGVKFSFGRVVRVCEPGFYPLVPILQIVRTVPSRARTLDLPRQRLTTANGLVFEVDANVVYRVLDPQKALIQVDSLEKGMLQILGLSVYELLAQLEGDELRVGRELDERLAVRMGQRLEAWGVAVERAGFATLNPSRETIRITQLRRLASTRAKAVATFSRAGLEGAALGLLGANSRPISRTRSMRTSETRHRRQRYLRDFEARLPAWLATQTKLSSEAKRTAATALGTARFKQLLAK